MDWVNNDVAGKISSGDFAGLSRHILSFANSGVPRYIFLKELSHILLDFSGCDVLEVRASDGTLCFCWRYRQKPNRLEAFIKIPCEPIDNTRVVPCARQGSELERVYYAVFTDSYDRESPNFTSTGSLWSNDCAADLAQYAENKADNEPATDFACASIAMLPFVIDESNVGMLILKSDKAGFFNRSMIEYYENLAQTIGLAIADRRAQWALRERIKELTCLYNVSRLSQATDFSLDVFLQGVVEYLPPAMQYPDIASAAITLDGVEYKIGGTDNHAGRLAMEIFVGVQSRGLIEVFYSEKKPELEDDPFLEEEYNLLQAVASQIALIIERRVAEEDKDRLQKQLIHADRLSTIGQLAAGVAHELNEPLGGILGFAQLAQKVPGLPNQASQDLERIITASLHTREIVKKLLIFARQMPTRRSQVDLNELVESGLYFIESRCAKEGIRLVKHLADDLLPIDADPSQMNQILVNLAVNAVQAMPHGGVLTIITVNSADGVTLTVQDTGIGMSEEILSKIFLPFFTTKEVGQGTGLGLPVVHGIVTAHGGRISVESAPGQGSRFEIYLPITSTEISEEANNEESGR
jgi:two-component system NtrC family sensor kinase